MKLEIITPEQIVFSGEVNLLTVPGTMGNFTILDHHAPIISSLGKGTITYRINNTDIQLKTSGGFIEVNDNFITICVEEANN